MVSIPTRISAFFDAYQGATPHLVISLDVVRRNYRALEEAMPAARHHYAIKANPHPDILRALHALGCAFECASLTEIDMCLEAGAAGEDILYGNPVKKVSEIEGAVARGVRQFVFDAEAELDKLIAHAPGAQLICRIQTTGEGAVSPLSSKFGCPPERAAEWLLRAAQSGMVAHGVSFHTGSQQLDPQAWRAPIAASAMVFDTLRKAGVRTMSVLDVGGGFPTPYRAPVPPVTAFGEAILQAMQDHFGADQPLIYTEPGRYLASDAGFILAEAVLIAPHHALDGHRWTYLDIGRYGGLVEEKIDYPVLPLNAASGPVGPVLLAGQTCDSNDVIYDQTFGYELPLALKPGDRVVLAHTGVYTTTYSTTLNGFPTLTSECV